MEPSPPRPSRRQAIAWMLAISSAALFAEPRLRGEDPEIEKFAEQSGTPARGYGRDPDLRKIYRPGDLWPLTFDDAQRWEAACLCDTILPADENSPGAAALGIHDFIDEWISGPYPACRRDRPVILEGLRWLDQESLRRFGIPFADLVLPQRHAILDDICYQPEAKPPFRRAAAFFRRFRDLTAGGFYTTPEGMKDIGYVGNVPLDRFEGPSEELLRKLGLIEGG